MIAWYWLVSLGILIVGGIIALFLATNYRKKAKGIKRYEKIADKLTVREPEPEPEEDFEAYEPSMLHSLPSLIMTLVVTGVVLVMGLMIMQEFSEAVEVGTMEQNVTSAMTESLVVFTDFIPIVFTIVIVIIVLGVIVGATNRLGREI